MGNTSVAGTAGGLYALEGEHPYVWTFGIHRLCEGGRRFSGDPVGLRQVGEATWDVYYCHQRIVRIGMLPEEDVGPDCAVNEAATYGSLRAQDGDPRGWARNAAGRRLVDALTAADDV
jgi:hypothetical protein